jgi:oxygen-independent coproporphyrinogen-3 oxidase
VYVHVPWCRRRCPYCAFYVEVDRDAPYAAFVDVVLREREARLGDARPDTVFLGGGTPSRLPPDELRRLVRGLAPVDGAEISMEVNPEDVDDALLDAMLHAGVTRPSLGLQTTDKRFARLLNRACTVDAAVDIARRIALAGFASFSLDLIFALPGQTLADLEADLDRVLSLEPPHLSLYGLTFEPGTAFARGRDRGRLVPADEETWRAMYGRLVDRLRAAGLERYEISNFARPGHRSRHNTLYWTDRPYVGLGPSAHGYADGTRWIDTADLGAYLGAADPTASEERPDPEARALDLLASCVRAAAGLDRRHLRARTGLDVEASALAALTTAGLLAPDPDRIVLTDEGAFVADGVAERLARHLGPAADRGRAGDRGAD